MTVVELGAAPAVRRLGTWTGRTALVTGAGSGLGAAIGRALVAQGADVTFADLDAKAAQRAADGSTGRGTASALTLDVLDAEALTAAVRGLRGRTGRFDYLVAAAGAPAAPPQPAQDMPLAEWTRLVDVDIRGTVHAVLAAYPLMVEQGHGHIVTVAGTAGLLPSGPVAALAMAQHAVVGLSLGLRAEGGAHGVGVTVVCPPAGPRTDRTDRDLAAQTLAAVEADKAMVAARAVQAAWLLGRAAPRLPRRLTRAR